MKPRQKVEFIRKGVAGTTFRSVTVKRFPRGF
jgi:hypothetical protein